MSRSATIPYVPLDPGAPRPTDATVVFVRLRGETFVNPPSDPPHRHDFHELLLVEEGSLRHTVDGETADLGPHSLALIARGQVHAVDRAIDTVGWMLRFAEEVLPAGTQAPFPARPGLDPVVALSPADLATLAPVADLIEAEAARPVSVEQDTALRALLTVLLLRVDRIRQAAGADPAARAEQRIYQDFVALLERDFAAHHGVAHYAGTLGLDPIRLSAILTRVLGITTKRAIDDRLVLEAKRLLRHTSLPLKAIATELGYADQFHLSKVFKRLTGVSPHDYRHPEKLT
jgi:AraC family transcriptional activator of pobA